MQRPSYEFNRSVTVMRQKKGRRFFWIVASIAWVISISSGIWVLWAYESTPGDWADSVSNWPEPCDIPLARERATLVVFAHPRCPCTRASIAELTEIMTRCRGLLETQVIFLRPRGCDDDWVHTNLWLSAKAIPDVTVREDLDGQTARQFGVFTSGHAILFDATGKRRFSGGITRARGQVGENPGSKRLVAILTQRTVCLEESPVFGCPLFDSGSPAWSTN